MSDSKFVDAKVTLTVTGPTFQSVAAVRALLDATSTPQMDPSWAFELNATEKLERLEKPEDDHQLRLITEGLVLGRYGFWHNAQFDFYFGRAFAEHGFHLTKDQSLTIRFDWVDEQGPDVIEHAIKDGVVTTTTRHDGLTSQYTDHDAQDFLGSIVW